MVKKIPTKGSHTTTSGTSTPATFTAKKMTFCTAVETSANTSLMKASGPPLSTASSPLIRAPP